MGRIKLYPALHWSTTPIARVLRPIQEFMERSTSGGIVLIIATIAALLLANSPLAEEYNELLHTEIGIEIGTFALEESLLHWINDGLMAIFFFLVGLEIKREVIAGELSSLRAALLPVVAAVGGAMVPALMYTALNFNNAGTAGWGIPMATDIAFALGALALLGSRIPFGLKVFLTAVAIVDDLLAVLVIAFFYSGGLNFTALTFGFVFLGVLVLGNLFGIRNTLFYVIFGLLVWFDFLRSGVHATIAGVLVAWTIPARNRIAVPDFLNCSRSILNRFERSTQEPSSMLTNEVQQSAIIALEEVCEDVQAPLQKLEHALHPWAAFLIIPIFAFANAGVALSLDSLAGGTSTVALGIVAGLVLGKPLGVLGASWLTVRMGLATLPPGVHWQHMIGLGLLAGIGFTMSLFIASLAFRGSELLEVAKLGILSASLIAGIIGSVLLLRVEPTHAGNEETEAE
jgi:NhaA family Na+:H+ antiporter